MDSANRRMGILAGFSAWAGAVVVTTALHGCITVPPEVVTLSSVATEDTRKLRDGYRSLVRMHFAALRAVREQQFADKVLTPYIERAIANARLVDVVQGKVVWDDNKGGFVAPDPTKASIQKLDTLSLLTRTMAAEIQELRASAFSDLDTMESSVVDRLDKAFGRVISADATIHAYLLSIGKIESAQRDVLSRAGLEDFPEKINESLAKASEAAKQWTGKVEGAAKKAEDLREKLK